MTTPDRAEPAARARAFPHVDRRGTAGEEPDGIERRRRPRDPEVRRRLIGRGRSFLRRFREPLIGLTIAGAAAPMIRGARETAPKMRKPTAYRRPAVAPAATGATPAAAPGVPASQQPIDEAVAERLARTRAERIREDTIQGAMLRYEISRDLAQAIYDLALEEDLDPDLAFGLVNVESSFKQRALSHVGARGLTQVMPATARWLRPGTTAEDLFDRHLNLRLGFRYLRDLIDKYRGNLHLALLAYNRGPGTVDGILRGGGDPDNGYADKVLEG